MRRRRGAVLRRLRRHAVLLGRLPAARLRRAPPAGVPQPEAVSHCLQRVAAELFCGGCGVTPYCSAGCQRRDYAERHRQVCHNLKRSASGGGVVPRVESQRDTMPAAAPLRRPRPRSPEPARRERRDDDSGSDRAAHTQHKFGPPGPVTTTQAQRPARPNQAQNRDDKQRHGHRGNQDDRSGNQNRSDDARGGGRNGQDGRGNDRHDNRNKQNRDDNARPSRLSDRLNNRSGDNKPDSRPLPKQDDEEWGAKPEPKVEASQPTPKPKPPPVQLIVPKLQPKAAPTPKEAPKEVTPVKITPDVASSSKILVPKDCLPSLLSAGESLTLSVEAEGSASRAGAGLVCLALHDRYTDRYMQLLDDAFTARCEAAADCTPSPGDTFVYLNPSDGAWYRARCLAADTVALLDAGKVVPLSAADRCHALPPDYQDIPEFCCLLEAAEVQISDQLNCTIVSKAEDTLKVTLTHLETGAAKGSGSVRRWLPAVDYPTPTPAGPAPAEAGTAPVAAAAAIPEVPRPPLTDKSRVLLVDATAPDRVFVRSALTDRQKEFDDVVMAVAVYGISAKPLTEPPVKGQTVVAKFTDGNHYRALCRRVNSKLNKYLLEYIEYGNTAVAFIEDLYPCPPELDLPARPTLASQASFAIPQKAFTEAATEYLDKLKDDSVELILTIPSGAASAASGSAVRLSVAQSGEDVSRAVATLCKPDWQRLVERGGDVTDIAALSFQELTYATLPEGGCELQVTDASMLSDGVLSAHERGATHAARAFALADRIAEYCDSALCKEPYLPKPEELCVAYCPTRKQWLRAALLQQPSGAGGSEADVLLFDYGQVASTPVAQLRKMMPEFMRGLPAVACSLEIRGFPKEPTEAQLALAKQHLMVNEQGIGTLRVTRCERLQEPGDYAVEAPELIRAMGL